MDKIKTAIEYGLSDRVSDMRDALRSAIEDKVAMAIQDRRVEVAQSVFDGVTESYGLDEAKKLIGTYNQGNRVAKVYHLTGQHDEGDPFHVKLHINDKHHEPADYFTNDREDAHSTAKHMVKESTKLDEVIRSRPFSTTLNPPSSMGRNNPNIENDDDAYTTRQRANVARIRKEIQDKIDAEKAAKTPAQKSIQAKEETELNEIGDTPKGRKGLKAYINAKRNRSMRDIESMTGKEKEDAAKKIYAARNKLDQKLKNVVVGEALGTDATAADWIHDFVHSKDPKFAGKSKEKRKEMALAAYYAKQRD